MRAKRAGDGDKPRSGSGASAPPAWLRNVAVWVGAGLAIVVLAVLGVAVLPGWWASLVGGWVQGVFGRGVPIGLGVGALFMLLPLAVGALALRTGLTSKTRVTLIVVALLLLLPNVLTIAIALGNSDARSVLAIAAPGFRGATAVGIGLVVLAVVAALVIRRRSRRTRHAIEEAREKAKQLSRERVQEVGADGQGTTPPVATEPPASATEPVPDPRSP